MSRERLETIIEQFNPEKFVRFFEEKSTAFRPALERESALDDKNFQDSQKIGEFVFESGEKLCVYTLQVVGALSERSGKKLQFEKGKEILKNPAYHAGIFIFSDENSNFRFSLIHKQFIGTRRQFNHFKRYTYFVSCEFTNKTFLQRIGLGDFSSLEKIKEAFAIGPVTDIFYNDFFVEFNKIVDAVQKENKIKNEEKARDFVLLFAIRIVFLGFIQKKKWLGDDEKFIQAFFNEYRINSFGKNEFYSRWLIPLFFEALNSPQGRKVAYGNNDFSVETEAKLQMAPYLNGGLFREKPGHDDNGWIIPDKELGDFFEFLFAHSFTIEENSIGDEDLQLNPEFLGIIFERLVNKADGAVYTPRTEVDFMCRLSLVKWLEKNLELPVTKTNLYELFFQEGEKEEDQKKGSFSLKESQEIIERLENLTICDPAVGSGAFLVGMMQVLDEVEQSLKGRHGISDGASFERKKRIIAQSLYGVEVKEWAVWIAQLRLWLSLFIEAPESMRLSPLPILPSLDFKVRQGDSLVQRIGSKLFPIEGHAVMGETLKKKVRELKKFKVEYFNNKKTEHEDSIFAFDKAREREIRLYEDILEDEIRGIESELHRMKNFKYTETPSLFIDETLPEQEVLPFNKDEIEELETEIVKLRNQKKLVREEKPLIWNIEFADIFLDKGGFDIIIGNPPYVRQEGIGDPTGKIKDNKKYKDLLQEMVRQDFPDNFPPKLRINAQSDLYTYFYIRGLKLLNPGGIHTFICSNSWLDVGYGVWLQKFLLERAPVEFIIDSSARTFAAADVNTIISVIHAPIKERKKHVDEGRVVKFIAFKKPFEESVFTENLMAIESADKVVSDEIFRVYPIAVGVLAEAGTEYESDTNKAMKIGKYVGEKWGGKYLRAPDIFFTILEKGKGKLVKLSDIADVRFGIKTGANEFFYLTDEQVKKWGIEEEFLKPVIKSPRECKSILVNPKDLKYKIFICNKSKEELKGTNALKYIEWGESQKTEDGVRWNDVPSVSGRRYWYGLGERVPTRLNFNYLIDQIGVTFVGEIFVSDNFHEIHREAGDLEGYMNSTLCIFFQNLSGRVGFGGGLLKIQTYELQRLPVLLSDATPINRELKSLWEECGIDPESKIPIEEQEPNPLPDRAALDKIVFDALELTEEERKNVYRAVCRLVWNRISKAKSV